MTDDDNHYTELQEVYQELISRHRKVRAKCHDPPEGRRGDLQQMKGRRDGLIESIQEIEDLLNEWHDRDDRDGE